MRKAYCFSIYINVKRFSINIKMLSISIFVGIFKDKNIPLAIFVLNIISKVSFSLSGHNLTCVIHKKGKLSRTIKRRVSKQIQCTITSPCANKLEMRIKVSESTISYNHQKQKGQNCNEHFLFHAITLLHEFKQKLSLSVRAKNPSKSSVDKWNYSFGKTTVNVVPTFSSLSTLIFALWMRTPCLTMDSPKPVPPISREWLLSTR